MLKIRKRMRNCIPLIPTKSVLFTRTNNAKEYILWKALQSYSLAHEKALQS